jgi:hypothetical protein
MSEAAISQHLSPLRAASLITTHHQGHVVVYAVDPTRVRNFQQRSRKGRRRLRRIGERAAPSITPLAEIQSALNRVDHLEVASPTRRLERTGTPAPTTGFRPPVMSSNNRRNEQRGEPAKMRRALSVAVTFASIAPFAVFSASASADPLNANSIQVTIVCPDASYTGVTIEHNSAVVFQLAGTFGVAISQEISFVDGTGETVTVRTNPGQGHTLVRCTYEYPGFPYLVTGLFQFPASVQD